MSEQTPSPQDQMMQWITAKWVTKPLHVVAELGVADLLQDGPLSVEDLAEKTVTHGPTLYRILRSLSAVGIFKEIGERVFGLTPLSQCLLSDAMRPLARMFLSDWHDKAWSGLDHSVRTGKPGFDHAFGTQSFEWLESHPEARALLDQGQATKAYGFAEALLKAYDFSDCSSICDIGGGQGTFLIRLLHQYPNMQGIVADMPRAVESAKRAIAQTDLRDRCRAIPFDFMKETPPACDAYFLVNVLHDWDDDVCLNILSNLSRAMKPETKLWVVEFLLEPGPGFNIAKLLDIEVLVMGGGRERSVAEYETLLNSAGLRLAQTIELPGGPALLECKRASL